MTNEHLPLKASYSRSLKEFEEFVQSIQALIYNAMDRDIQNSKWEKELRYLISSETIIQYEKCSY